VRPNLSSKPSKVTRPAARLSTRCAHRISTCFAQPGELQRRLLAALRSALHSSRARSKTRFRAPNPCPFSARAEAEDSGQIKDPLEVLATCAKTLRGALSPNVAPWPERFSGINLISQLDAGRATRVAEIRPASHTLLSTYCLYHEGCVLRKLGLILLSQAAVVSARCGHSLGSAPRRLGPVSQGAKLSDVCGRMSDMASNRITIRIPGDLGDRLRHRSRILGHSESKLVRQALESYLGQPDGERPAYELAAEAGLIGCVRRAPRDLSTNPRHLNGFGRTK